MEEQATETGKQVAGVDRFHHQHMTMLTMVKHRRPREKGEKRKGEGTKGTTVRSKLGSIQLAILRQPGIHARSERQKIYRSRDLSIFSHRTTLKYLT